MEYALYEGMRTEPAELTWWADYIPWLALGLFVTAIVLSVVFLPAVLRGGMSRFAITKNLLGDDDPQGSQPAQASAVAAVVTDGQQPQPDEPHASSAPTWKDLDLSIFDEA